MNTSYRKKKSDRIFDGWAERFEQRIYADDNPKGLIRKAVLQRDLGDFLPESNNEPLKIIDVGGGLGHMAIWLAKQGHQVCMIEPSRDMLRHAQKRAETEKDCPTDIEFINQTLQEISEDFSSRFDLVICHAVLEWLADPHDALLHLKTLMKPDAMLSLMYYNRFSAMMRSLLVGDFKRANSSDLSGDGIKRLAPISPLDPSELQQWLTGLAIHVHRWSGIRTFYDYMLPDVRLRSELDNIVTTELRLSTQLPWRDMARYQHIIGSIGKH